MIPLHELNKQFFAALLPATHGPDAVTEEKPKAKPKGKAAATAADSTPQYSAEQLEILKAAGITDPATADAAQLAALLGA